jgi:hypothetical protein
MRAGPFDMNYFSLHNLLQRPEPARAMTCQQQVSRLSSSDSAEHAGRTKGQRAWSRAFQNDFVISQTRDFQPRNWMRVGPWPWRASLAGLHAVIPRPPDQDAREFGLGM